MQPTKVKTAVVGCGMISSIYIRNLSQMFSVIDLCAVCNRTREAAEARAKEFGIARAMTIDEAAADARDHAMLSLLYEAGARVSVRRVKYMDSVLPDFRLRSPWFLHIRGLRPCDRGTPA